MMIFDKTIDLHNLLNTDVAGGYLQLTSECIAIPYTPKGKHEFTAIPVLKFLWGMRWNNLTLNWISSLRPSALTVVTNSDYVAKLPWEVVVRVHQLKTDNVIEFLVTDIQQNSCVGLIGVENAQKLVTATNYVIQSTQK